ncbi:hypothetical protein [Tenacibaculum phage Larrie]|nr:hypothetical protein [Tenacibaculum phage Larrie]
MWILVDARKVNSILNAVSLRGLINTLYIMYTFRTFTNNGVQTDYNLGESYNLFSYERMTEESWNKIFKEVYKTDFEKDKNKTRVIITGECIRTLSKGEVGYIVTENGKTLRKVTGVDSAEKPIIKTNNLFTLKEMVKFGNYLLSEERHKKLVHKTNKRNVTDADISNYLSEV